MKPSPECPGIPAFCQATREHPRASYRTSATRLEPKNKDCKSLNLKSKRLFARLSYTYFRTMEYYFRIECTPIHLFQQTTIHSPPPTESSHARDNPGQLSFVPLPRLRKVLGRNRPLVLTNSLLMQYFRLVPNLPRPHRLHLRPPPSSQIIRTYALPSANITSHSTTILYFSYSKFRSKNPSLKIQNQKIIEAYLLSWIFHRLSSQIVQSLYRWNSILS